MHKHRLGSATGREGGGGGGRGNWDGWGPLAPHASCAPGAHRVGLDGHDGAKVSGGGTVTPRIRARDVCSLPPTKNLDGAARAGPLPTHLRHAAAPVGGEPSYKDKTAVGCHLLHVLLARLCGIAAREWTTNKRNFPAGWDLGVDNAALPPRGRGDGTTATATPLSPAAASWSRRLSAASGPACSTLFWPRWQQDEQM